MVDSDLWSMVNTGDIMIVDGCWWYIIYIYTVYIYICVCVWRFPKMTPQRAPLEAFSRRSLMTEIICSLWDLDPDLCSWSEISRCSTSFCCCCCCCRFVVVVVVVVVGVVVVVVVVVVVSLVSPQLRSRREMCDSACWRLWLGFGSSWRCWSTWMTFQDRPGTGKVEENRKMEWWLCAWLFVVLVLEV